MKKSLIVILFKEIVNPIQFFSWEILILENCYPLAPTMPPLGAGAHAMPPYYLHRTFRFNFFPKTRN